MKNFRSVLKEVNIIVDEILAFDIILTTVLIFLVCYFILMLFVLNPWYGLFPALAYLGFLLYIDLNANKYRMVENSYTPLYEKLRTAADTVNQENELVEELQKEVVSDLSNVRVSSFVKINTVSYKVLGSIILCLLILFASIYNVHFGDLSFAFDKVKQVIEGREGSGKGNQTGEDFVAGNDGDDRDIYGEDSVAKLGGQELEIKIKQASAEMIGSEVSEPPKKEFTETFPDEVFATASGSYEEKIPLENQKLIKEYFKELGKT